MSLDPNQWLWFSAVGVLLVLVVIFVAYKLAHKSRPNDAIADQQDGWTPTGRIDFSDPESIGIFILRAEDTRIVDSIGGVEHREICWRTATLDDAKNVVVAYHAQRNLATKANYVVSTRTAMQRNSDMENVHQKAQLLKDEASDGKPI